MMTDHDTTDQPLQLDGAFAIATDSRDQLHDLCVRTLTELLGSAPEVDEDGDIAVPVHGFGLYVTVAEDGPQLHVWASVLSELGDGAAAAQNLPELSAEWPRLRFTIEDGHLLGLDARRRRPVRSAAPDQPGRRDPRAHPRPGRRLRRQVRRRPRAATPTTTPTPAGAAAAATTAPAADTTPATSGKRSRRTAVELTLATSRPAGRSLAPTSSRR
ncbi:hypothetical protein P9209_23600 [Prescottella defluvii]|nr:hypothetical protein P9209_23600 [Prescottella defluvii]